MKIEAHREIVEPAMNAPDQTRGCLHDLQDLRNAPRLTGRLHFYVYFLDIAALVLTSLALYFLLDLAHAGEPWVFCAAATCIAGFAYTAFSFSSGIYDWRRFRQSINAPLPTIGAIIFAFGGVLFIAFLFKFLTDISRVWLLSWFAGFSGYILISRIIIAWYLSRPETRTHFARRAVILGAGENGQTVLDHILRFANDIDVLGFIDDRTTRTERSHRHVPILGGLQSLEQLIRDLRVDLVIVALPWHALERISALTDKLGSWSVDVYLAPEKLGLYYADRPLIRIAGMPVLSLKDRPINEWKAVVKRIEDLCIAIPALLLLSPLFALVALAIKLESKGDVIFVQKRFGFNNDVFNLYKFRSMYSHMTDWDGIQQASKDDPRVTKVGRLIRKTSIDELPQLYNVFLGNMSIVGPRPHAVGMQIHGQSLFDLLQEYASRHRVKPGITGWAQCNGWRGEAATLEHLEKRVQHDLYYIENWSIMLDALVLAKTLSELFRGGSSAQ